MSACCTSVVFLIVSALHIIQSYVADTETKELKLYTSHIACLSVFDIL